MPPQYTILQSKRGVLYVSESELGELGWEQERTNAAAG
jgi:hypothetical protein